MTLHSTQHHQVCALSPSPGIRNKEETLRIGPVGEGPNRVSIYLLSSEDINRSTFGNVVSSSYLEFLTRYKVQKPSDSGPGKLFLRGHVRLMKMSKHSHYSAVEKCYTQPAAAIVRIFGTNVPEIMNAVF
jgi:hypothetical protein